MNAPVVHLVDDDKRVLDALARLLATEHICTVSSTSANQFLSRYDPTVPGCVVLDLAMPDEGGLTLQEKMLDEQMTVPVVFLSGCDDVPAAVRAMKAGALDFLTKPVEAETFIDVVRYAIARDVAQREHIEATGAVRAALGTLTPREREILPYLASGKLNKQIATDLGVVEKTVNVHRAHVMAKLHLGTRAELVRFVERLHAPAESIASGIE